MNNITYGWHAANTQLGQVHLVFQTGHGCFNPGTLSMDIEERLSSLIEPTLSVGDPHRRVLKPGGTAVVLVGLNRASQHVGASPTVGKLKAGLKSCLGCRS